MSLFFNIGILRTRTLPRGVALGTRTSAWPSRFSSSSTAHRAEHKVAAPASATDSAVENETRIDSDNSSSSGPLGSGVEVSAAADIPTDLTASQGSESDFMPKIRRVDGRRPKLDWTSPPKSRAEWGFEREQETAAGRKQYYRFVRLFGLHPEVTHLDIVKGISETAPVGRVLSVDIGNKVSKLNQKDVRFAFVLFDHEAAPQDLLRLSKQGSFLVHGETPHVALYRDRAFNNNDPADLSSRVLQLCGSPDVEGFSEEELRELLLSNQQVAQALGPLGLSSEPVEWRIVSKDKILMEWRFFDNHKQVKVLLPILRRLFYRELSVWPGPDPCWNSEIYPRDRHNTGNAMYLGFLGRTTEHFKQHRASGATSAPLFRGESTLPSRLAQIIGSRRSEAYDGARGKRGNDMVQKDERLNKDERQRVRAWTELAGRNPLYPISSRDRS